MGRLWTVLLFITILSRPVSFLKAEEDYIYIEQRDPVTGKTEIKKMKNVFTEKTPKRRSEQVMEETFKGATEGAGTGAVGSLITSGGATMPAAVGVGASLGAAKGVYKGATEPTEYDTFDKTRSPNYNDPTKPNYTSGTRTDMAPKVEEDYQLNK